ncbi:hypothetical protein HOD38_05260 [archaeon]|jgi:hypothetical protein|nr:hypothetical protein [archaeon]MBT4397648.1 hypothetical protein [archaeon]MBT4441656.1 hypothetical protein [archaeon]
MMEFNPDGSMKLPEHMNRKKEENKEKLKKQRCICVKREVVNFSAPKKCVLQITLSEALSDNRFIETIYNYFKEKATVPHKLTKINEKQFEVEIGTDFKRCSDCNHLISEYRQFFGGNIIDEKGTCTFKGRSFCYEDYF